MRTRIFSLLLAAGFFCVPTVRAGAQRIPTRPDTLRADSLRRDSLNLKPLIQWEDPDSVMKALLARPGRMDRCMAVLQMTPTVTPALLRQRIKALLPRAARAGQ